MFSIYFIIDLLDTANKYSSLFVIVAAITTIATGFYKVRKNMPNGTFRLRKEHTNTLKNNSVLPVILPSLTPTRL